MSIRTRIISLIVVPVVICVLFAQVSSGVVSKRNATKNMQLLSSNLNDAYNNAIARSMENFSVQVEAIAREQAFFDNQLSDQEKAKVLQRHAANSDIDNIGIFGANGKNLFIGYEDGTTVPAGVADISARPYLPRALAGETVVFGPSSDVVSGRLTITIATPSNAPGAPSSVVAIDFDLDAINAIVSNIAFGETGRAYLVDGEGMFIASADKALLGKTYQEISSINAQYAGLSEAVHTALSTDEEELYYKEAGEQYATCRTVAGTDGWRLLTAASTDEYFADYNRNVVFQLSIMLVYLVLVAVVGIYFGKRISDPIRYASERVVALAQGDLEPIAYPQAENRKDEIGELIRSLSEAVNELQMYIGDISGKLGAMAGGNLDLQVTQEYRGDFAPIKSSLTTIIQSFNAMLLEIDRTADQVAGGSGQVANGAQALAQGSTEQAGSTEHIAISMDTAAQQMTQAAQQATEAQQRTGESHQAIVGVRAQMDRMLESMQAISESSESIGKILKSIDDIAFQTNILALNAAVEAARAGTHGKGFAVVADEVRNLAAKSAEAAHETGELIESSIHAVSIGREIADETAREIDAAVQGADSVGELIQQLENVVNEQTQAFAKITEAVEQISAVTQTNSATAEQSAAASEQLASQAQMLKALISRVNLAGADTRTPQSFAAGGMGDLGGIDNGSDKYGLSAPQGERGFAINV